MIREYLDRAGAQVLANAIKNGKYEKITYQNLVTKRGSQELVPGKLYRITDYNTSVNQTGVTTAGHVFDLIVMALDKNALSEEACAITHAGATSYWENSNLSAWRIWYCLDNDSTRFAWADDSVDNGNIGNLTYYDNIDYQEYECVRYAESDEIVNNIKYYGWRYYATSNTYSEWFTTDETQVNSNLFYKDGNNFIEENGVRVTTYVAPTIGTGLPNGKGVIYRMIDEWGNDCPYDFKNVMFTRKLNNEGVYDTTNGTDTPVYTFDYNSSGNGHQDASVVAQTLVDYEHEVPGVHDNVITTQRLKYTLPNNVFLTFSWLDNGDYFYDGVIGNKIDGNENTFGTGAMVNILEKDCINNVFGNYCFLNRLGQGCVRNFFASNCAYNILNTLCNENTFGPECSRNEFGVNCARNKLGENCSNNKFNLGCDNNVLGNWCDMNNFDIYASSIVFGTGTPSSPSTINRVRLVDVGQYVNNVNLTGVTAPTGAHYLKNIRIETGVAGTAENRKTITAPLDSDALITYVTPNNQTIVV